MKIGFIVMVCTALGDIKCMPHSLNHSFLHSPNFTVNIFLDTRYYDKYMNTKNSTKVSRKRQGLCPGKIYNLVGEGKSLLTHIC